MFEICVLNKKNNKSFIRVYNSSIEAWKFVRKIKYSKNLDLLYIYDYSYMFD